MQHGPLGSSNSFVDCRSRPATWDPVRVKRLVPGALAVLLTACTATPSSPSAATTPTADQTPAVKAAYDNYRKAALDKNGDAAAAVVAKPVLDFYVDAAKKALTATDTDLAGTPATTRIVVYTLRAEFEPDVLRAASGRELVKFAIDQGLISEQSVTNFELGAVTVTGDSAQGEAIRRGQQTPLKYAFTRENGEWKLDLMPLLDMGNGALEDLAKQRQTTVDKLIDATLAQKYGPERVKELHQPLE